MALPCLVHRPRAGVHRTARYRSVSAGSSTPGTGTDPITLGSIIYDFWYKSDVKYLGAAATDGGSVDQWSDRYAGESATTAAGANQNYSSTLGIANGRDGILALSIPVGLTPPFTVYVLANYGNTSIYPICGGGSGFLDNISATAAVSNLQDNSGLYILGGTIVNSGERLFRWRVTSGNAAYFKDGTTAEESLGSFPSYVQWEHIFGIPGVVAEATNNRTKRITAFSADLVAGGQSTAVETFINAAG